MPLPNLIIAGAPKCGTSSVFRWLTAHPQVCGSKPKELFYLIDSDNPLRSSKVNYHSHGLEGYENFFKDCPEAVRITCEATTHYIYQKTAISSLAKLSPPPTVIFILRKPERRVYSSYQFTFNNLSRFTSDISFKQYIHLAKNLSLNEFSQYLNDYKSAYVLYNDIHYSCYIEYLAEWQARFSGNIYIFLLEDIMRDERLFMQKLSTLLEIDPFFYDGYEFKRKNSTIVVKNKSLHRKLHKLSALLPVSALKKTLRDFYLNFQSHNEIQEVEADDKETLAKLSDYFEPYNAKLANSFDLDLSSWK